MKKTLLITIEYPPMIGGVANYYQNLVAHLPEGSIEVFDNSKNALVSRARFFWPKWLPAVFAVRKRVREQGIEHILVGQILPLGTVALVLYWMLGTPYTVMTHAMDVTVPFGPKGSRFKRLLMKRILQSAHSVTAVSSYTKMQLESELLVPPRKIVMVYPCPHHSGLQYTSDEIAAMQNRMNTQYDIAGKKVLLSVGRLVERKGIDYVLASLAQVKKSIPDILYVVIGDGSYRSTLMRLAEKFDVAESVLFCGAVSDEDVIAWYARCDAFIMPSRELKNRDVEGFGIVYVEANSFGKPVIGGKSGGVLDAVIDGENGYLVNADDVDMIGDAVVRLLQNADIAQQLGEQGRERVQQFFQWHIQAKKIEELLKSSYV